MARYSLEDLGNLNSINPSFRQHSTQRPINLPPSFPDVHTARVKRRAHLDALLQYMPIPTAIPHFVDEKEVLIPSTATISKNAGGADGFKIPVTVYSPAGELSTATNDTGLPVVMLIHEGGWH